MTIGHRDRTYCINIQYSIWVIPTGYGKLKIITGSCPLDSYYGKTEHGDHNSKQGWKDICAFAVCIASLVLGTIPHILISDQATAKCK